MKTTKDIVDEICGVANACKATKSKKKYLVEVWEHRQVSFEVEAESEDEAKAVAEDAYANDETLQRKMVEDDESVVCDEVKVLQCLGDADGIVATEKD